MAVDINTEMTTPSTEYGGAEPAHAPRAIEPAPARGLTPGIWIGLLVILVLLGAAVVYGLWSRSTAEKKLVETSKDAAVLTVNITHPTINGTQSEIALPGNTQAFNDTPIYARTNGYLKAFYVDIGQRINKGKLMATIETPEVDEQLQVAQANLKSAQADLALANTTSERYQNLLKQDSVSKQETDVAISGAAAHQAALDAAEANVRRLQQLQSFEKIYAPFSGVVTARNTDIGALIDSGSGSAQPRDLFRIASTDKLRVFVAVPETYAPAIHNGDTATLTLQEYPGQQFVGTIARNSNAIDMTSRTLNVEVDVNNADGKLLPGAYAFVHFKLPQQVRQLSVPANTLLFRAEGLRVGVVRDGRVHLQPVTIAKDNGATLQIATGLTANDAIILDPSDSLAEGQSVEISSKPVEVR
ncbi:MAG TPA: efflux RND transporter periplasmic adaptor subunit [Acidobacteriaceae bacterium]|jgi:RND family efflux transporter MFP subunit